MPGWLWKSSQWRAIVYLSVILIMLAWISCLKNALHIENKFRVFLRHSFCKMLPYSFSNAVLGFWLSLILDKQVSERYVLVCGLCHISVVLCTLNAEIGSNFSCARKKTVHLVTCVIIQALYSEFLNAGPYANKMIILHYCSRK